MLKCKYLIIGSGQTGQLLARELVKTGKKVILVEQDEFGGSYLNSFELPKHLLNKEAGAFYASLKNFKNNSEGLGFLKKYREAIFEKNQEIIKSERNKRLNALEKSGHFEIILGKAEFFSKSLVEVNSSTERHLISFENCLIATGRNTMVKPKLKDLSKIDFLFQHNTYLLENIPTKIAVVGCTLESLQLASIYSQLGIKVLVFETKPASGIISRMDSSALNYLIKSLNSNQVEFFFEAEIKSVKPAGKQFLVTDSERREYKVNAVYNQVEETFEDNGLNLEKIKIKSTKKGISVNAAGRTAYKNILAFGNCAASSGEENKLAQIFDFTQNELKSKAASSPNLSILSGGFFDKEVSSLNLNLVKVDGFTPISTVGMSEKIAISSHGTYIKNHIIYDELKDGFIKIIYKENTLQILGISLAGDFARELTDYSVLCLKKGLNVKQLRSYLKAIWGV